MKKNIFFPYSCQNTHPGFSVDCVILTFHDGRIKVLLAKRDLINHYWVLPGGFMFKDENADEAAYRALEHYTKSRDIFLQQFYLFSDPKRTENAKYLTYKGEVMTQKEDWKWLLDRFITLGYFALVKYEKVVIPTDTIRKIKWFDIKNLPELYADHKFIIETAISKIRATLPIIPIGYELLPEKFTMTELRKCYEIILDKKFDRRNFQRKILQEGNVIQLDEKKGKSEYNASTLYTFDKEKIDKLQLRFV